MTVFDMIDYAVRIIEVRGPNGQSVEDVVKEIQEAIDAAVKREQRKLN